MKSLCAEDFGTIEVIFETNFWFPSWFAPATITSLRCTGILAWDLCGKAIHIWISFDISAIFVFLLYSWMRWRGDRAYSPSAPGNGQHLHHYSAVLLENIISPSLKLHGFPYPPFVCNSLILINSFYFK